MKQKWKFKVGQEDVIFDMSDQDAAEITKFKDEIAMKSKDRAKDEKMIDCMFKGIQNYEITLEQLLLFVFHCGRVEAEIGAKHEVLHELKSRAAKFALKKVMDAPKEDRPELVKDLEEIGIFGNNEDIRNAPPEVLDQFKRAMMAVAQGQEPNEEGLIEVDGIGIRAMVVGDEDAPSPEQAAAQALLELGGDLPGEEMQDMVDDIEPKTEDD